MMTRDAARLLKPGDVIVSDAAASRYEVERKRWSGVHVVTIGTDRPYKGFFSWDALRYFTAEVTSPLSGKAQK